jgi:ABC-type antimicrobial peptide transport system permease subunit
MFVPFQSPFALKVLVVDADDDAATRARLTRALSVSHDARVDLQSLATARDLELSPFRFNALVVGAFALLTLLLAAVGVSGVMAAIVGERTREYGIRMALGATPERVSALVLRQAGVPIAVGALGGLLLSAWASRLAASVLYNVAPRDPVSFAAASLMIIACGVGATWWPAQRASRVDPAVVLKAE